MQNNYNALLALFESLSDKKYTPFYKWMHRGMKALPILGEEVGALLSELSLTGIHKVRWRFALPTEMVQVLNTDDRIVLIVEEICALIKKRLQDEEFAFFDENFLAVHADEIQARIGDPVLRAMHVTEG
jgi:hypothetical protein